VNRLDLQKRIIEGHRRKEQLCHVICNMPKGPKYDEVSKKVLRLLRSLHDLEDGFIELYPDSCLFHERRCTNPNKGTFVCRECANYINVFAGDQGTLL